MKVVGIRFRRAGKIYPYDPCGLELRKDMKVIVEAVWGIEMGTVVYTEKDLPEGNDPSQVKHVIRIATAEDLEREGNNRKKEATAYGICLEKIAKHGLAMKLVAVEYTFDGNKILFYFTADGRIDFRELVKDLASVFHTRIELRQIGVRDEAKMLGGLGPCGRPVCCNAFLDDFRPVSIKMAKEQNLSLSPTKISGLCGRLMCCLQYEQNVYEEMKKVMPRVGKEINTIDGVGTVVENNAITERTKVRLTMEDGTIDVREYPYTHLSPVGEPIPQIALDHAAQKSEQTEDFAAMARRENGQKPMRNRKPARSAEAVEGNQLPEQKLESKQNGKRQRRAPQSGKQNEQRQEEQPSKQGEQNGEKKNTQKRTQKPKSNAPKQEKTSAQTESEQAKPIEKRNNRRRNRNRRSAKPSGQQPAQQTES
jgi:cell fate regulator YaaT (PSP1 superfamily)